MARTVELNPRIVPAQKRSAKTLQHILDTSGKLLEEVGLDNFNTNLIAERADIRISTVYRYFPNKHAILGALVQRYLDQIEGLTCRLMNLRDPKTDWRKSFLHFIDGYRDIVLQNTGHLVIRRALLASPELVRMEAKLIRILTVDIATALEVRGVQHSRTQLLNVLEVFMSTTAQAIDLAIIKGKKRKEFVAEIVAETKLLQLSYLANYLD